MKVIIVEDEIPALEKLERYILKYDASFKVVARLVSIADAVNWIQNHPQDFDLAFLDIQLTDGLSFDIFNQVKINKPVIFVTAFDEYAIDAFKVNSIDYILKPITFTEVSKALNKLKNLKTYLSANTLEIASQAFQKKKIKDRFLVRLGKHIRSIQSEDITLFYAEGRTVFLITKQGKKFTIDFKLEDLEKILDDKQFFRASRTYILNFSAIVDVIMYSNSRLKVSMQVKVDKDIIVSRERVADFKKWFEGN